MRERRIAVALAVVATLFMTLALVSCLSAPERRVERVSVPQPRGSEDGGSVGLVGLRAWMERGENATRFEDVEEVSMSGFDRNDDTVQVTEVLESYPTDVPGAIARSVRNAADVATFVFSDDGVDYVHYTVYDRSGGDSRVFLSIGFERVRGEDTDFSGLSVPEIFEAASVYEISWPEYRKLEHPAFLASSE